MLRDMQAREEDIKVLEDSYNKLRYLENFDIETIWSNYREVFGAL
jgi:hypothetical protein